MKSEIPNYDKVVIDKKGSTMYTLDGKLHRTDGPALIFSDNSYGWFLYDKLHRIDGPAICLQNSKHLEYWIDNCCYTNYENFKFTVFALYGKRIID